MKITLTCPKDPCIAEYATREILPVHARAYARATEPGKAVVLHQLRRELRAEAQRQHWYDYVEVPGQVPGTLRRTPITEQGKPKLLVPEVVVE